jgi:hypothetical protein
MIQWDDKDITKYYQVKDVNSLSNIMVLNLGLFALFYLVHLLTNSAFDNTYMKAYTYTIEFANLHFVN